jgi:hypothetical protein
MRYGLAISDTEAGFVCGVAFAVFVVCALMLYVGRRDR